MIAPFGRRLCEVALARQAGAYRLVGIADPAGPPPDPGQFYMLATADDWGSADHDGRPYLARAFSVCRVRDRRLDFLLEAIGPGTERLERLCPGEPVWVVGPLGVGFTDPGAGAPDDPARILVGGGIGVAPLVVWSEALAAARTVPRVLLGFRSGEHAGAAALFGESEVELATDDGTAPTGGPPAQRGFVTDLLERRLDEGPAIVFACGPPMMLEAVRRICTARGTPAQLALEAGMACGFGACFGCVVRTRDGYRRLCVDGPVVEAAELDEAWV